MAKWQIKCLRCDWDLGNEKLLCEWCTVKMSWRQSDSQSNSTYRGTPPTYRVRGDLNISPARFYVWNSQMQEVQELLNVNINEPTPIQSYQPSAYQQAMYGSSTSSIRVNGLTIDNEWNVTENNESNPF